MVRAERATLVDALAALPADDWDKPSLLPGWKVRDGAVVAADVLRPTRREWLPVQRDERQEHRQDRGRPVRPEAGRAVPVAHQLPDGTARADEELARRDDRAR